MLSYITVVTAHVTSKIVPADGDIISLEDKSFGKYFLFVGYIIVVIYAFSV